MYLVIDTETTGKARDFKSPASDLENWPRIVQLAWAAYDAEGAEINSACSTIKPDGWTIPDEAAAVHGINTDAAILNGIPIAEALEDLRAIVAKCQVLVAHNIGFDYPVVSAEFLRLDDSVPLAEMKRCCTMAIGTDLCKLPGRYRFKWPRLDELHSFLFGVAPEQLHDAMADVTSCAKCFFEMRRLGHIPA